MEDGELIASWNPEGARSTLILRFEDASEMYKAQARVTQALNGWTDEGVRYDGVETAFMGTAQLGRRDLLGDEVVTFLTVTTKPAMIESEEARRGALLAEQKIRAVIGASLTTVAWKPSDETIDLLERWAEEAVAVYPVGEGWQPRAKVTRIRDGFNAYAADHGRPELALRGTSGGRSFSDFVRSRFKDDVRYVRQGSNPYFVGLYRKSDAKRDWFPTIVGTEDL